jgi:lysophospholipase L1-like esterase
MLCAVLMGGWCLGTMPVTVSGDWEVTVGPGTIGVGESEVRLTESVRLAIAPPEIRAVRDECYTDVPAFNPDTSGWRKGARLRPLITQECSATGLLNPASLRVKLRPDDAEPLVQGADYDIDPFWATFGRLEMGSIARRQAVFVDYEYRPNRLDSIVADASGALRVIPGQSGVGVVLPPDVPADGTLVANIWVTGMTTQLTDDSVYTIEHEPAPVHMEESSAAARLLPKTLAKLRAGGTVTIVAFGDSVTNGGGVEGHMNDWYQHQFAMRLAARFPRATIRMLTAAWGGASSKRYLDETAGGDYDFARDVLEPQPDLVTLEFVNDAYLDEEGVRAQYAGILERVRGVGGELVLITPHLVRPDWMNAPSEQITTDPRPYVQALHQFSGEYGVALADASRLWCGLAGRGIPYTTLLANSINHPDVRGQALFADALMALFPEE